MSLCQDPITLAIFDSERMASYRVGSASIRASSATETFHTISSAISLDPDVGTSVHACTTNLTSPSASDESRRLRMLVNGRNMGLGKDGPLNSVGDVVANVGSPLQAGGSLLIRGDTDVLYKLKMAQIQQQQQQSKTHNNSMLFPVSNHKVQISIYTIKILKLAVVAV